MTPPTLVLAAVGLLVGCGLLGLALRRAWLAAAGAVAASGVGLAGALAALASGQEATFTAAWQIPGGALIVGVDPLSAFFLVPVLALGAACAVYGRAYLGPRATPAAAFDLLLGAMIVVLVARHALLFLVAWEVMTLLAYLLVVSDHGKAEVRRAGWIYLVASHVAVLALMALFLAWGQRAGGSLDFAALPRAGAGLLSLALLGFGIKAGVVGAHVWLPEAHAAAPSHVSALMSGSLVTMGIYGLARVGQLGGAGAGFGVALMLLGAAGALLGIALALVQRDLKRVLAYSTVENMGLVLLGLGLGFWSRAHGEPRVAALAFAAALLHVWNHAAMKGLLFLAAGGVVHATGTRDLERTGGLLRRMPWSGGAMLLGAVAIAGLPPLAGFSGEWLLYRALTATAVDGAPAAGLAAIGGAAVLALTGGLALLCFVRLTGVVLLGTARSAEAAAAHEAPPAMTVPMIALAALCLAGAPAAPWSVELMTPLLRSLGAPGVDSAASTLPEVALASLALLLLVAGGAALALRRLRRAPMSETWGCGYAAPEPRMQYAAGGFSELMATRVLPRWLRPRPSLRAPEGLLPRAASFASDSADPLTRAVYEPGLVRIGDRFARLRFLQQGNVHLYLLYILVTTVVALGWMALRDWWRP